MIQKDPFKWKHFQKEIILLCVRWYLRYSLSYRDLEEMMLERGIEVDHTTIYRWVMELAPEIDKRSRPYLNPTNDSWKVDETYIKVKGVWKYLYRAVDSEGNTLEFMLSAKRDKKAAKRFFSKALKAKHNQQPRVVNVDKNAAYPPAFKELKQEESLNKDSELRPIKYLNNLLEQDHRFIKRRVNPGLGFKSFNTARRTIQGYEMMNAIRKGQINNIKKGDTIGQKKFIESLFAMAV
ncbi:MAG: IS6 family transposase [Microcystaceae cyanobacterium]